MLNQNQNRYKFTVKQPQQQQHQQSDNQFNRPNPPSAYNQNYNNRNQTNQFKQVPKVEEHILIDDKDEDDDLLDISDTELIRASQAVESQLKFTNNVHQATSNAITIFSQFTNTQTMGPPQTTTIYSNSNLNYDGIDDFKSEIKQLKNENMQKDGEVKILRDKLKRLEQETQKIRNEKMDLIKKLQQQQDEAKKYLQKQIEFKELENQFKAQELVELTMKYKVLESSVRKNPNTSVLSSNPCAVNSQKPIQQPKSVPTKRSANNSSTSDTENENPEIKRPLLSRQTNTTNLRPAICNPGKTLPAKKVFKRNCVLKTKNYEPKNKETENLIYKLTDQFSEAANYLSRINSGKASSDLLKKLTDLNNFLKILFKSKLDIMCADRVDFICEKLNDELVKFLNLNLKYFDVENQSFEMSQIDLNCLLFDNIFRLFMIRFNVLIDANDSKLINKIKQNFFLIITQFLDYLKYPFIKPKASFISYVSLKIFNSILDVFNFTLYYPMSLFDSKKQLYYLCLVDNLHSIFKNMTLNDPIDNNEDDNCLYELFYDKLTKFYTDVIYWLNLNESNRSVDESIQPVSNQPEIITTIYDESKNSKIDFKLENRISENYLMNSSLTETDDMIFQSQLDPSVAVSKPQIPTPQPQPQLEPQAQQVQLKVQDTENVINPDLIQNLKLDFFTKFIYFLHNYQLIDSLEVKILNGSKSFEDNQEENCSKKRKIYQSMSNLSQSKKFSHSQSCSCFKDMLNSFLCLIDYQFNELNKKESYLDKLIEQDAPNLLFMISFYTFMCLTNTEKYTKFKNELEIVKQKLIVLDSFRDDYRLKNFLCMYKLSDIESNDKDKMEVDNVQCTNKNHDYLKCSLISLKSLFKGYIDDYFDFTQNQD